MSTDTVTDTLKEAWAKRLALIEGANALYKKAAGLEKDRFKPQQNTKISLWYAAMDAHYTWHRALHDAREEMLSADTIWYKAVQKAKGDIRIEWTEKNGGYACTLETGEVFEP